MYQNTPMQTKHEYESMSLISKQVTYNSKLFFMLINNVHTTVGPLNNRS